jgi:hypothetical protein
LVFFAAPILVSEETARKVEQSLPSDRFVTITPVKEEPLLQLGQNKLKSSVFDRHQPKLTDKKKEQALCFARHLSKPKRKQKTS